MTTKTFFVWYINVCATLCTKYTMLLHLIYSHQILNNSSFKNLIIQTKNCNIYELFIREIRELKK